MDTYIVIDYISDTRDSLYRVADCAPTALRWLDEFFYSTPIEDVVHTISNRPHEEFPVSVYERI